jgi:N-methylhydantoinase B
MSLDPVTFAVLTNAFKAVVNEMNLTMFRSAYSPVITEGRDIGGAVFDAQGRLVAQGEWDLAVFVVGHWPDVGGQEPGSFVANAREHFQEGVRIPPIKLIMGGKPNTAVYDLIAANMRLPADRMGDLMAQVGATKVGQVRLVELAEKFSWPTIAEAMAGIIAHSEQLLRAEIGKMPNGTYYGEDYVDMESLDRPIPKKIHVKLTITDDSLQFDFSGSDPESLSASNSTYSATSSAVFVTTKSLFPDIPMNYGCFAPLEVIAPAGTVVNARPPRAISSMAATVYEKVIGASLQALALAVPEQAVGCPYNLINLTIGGHYQGDDYVAYLYSEGGFGGRASKDGPAGLVSLYGGGAKITPAEVMERRYPMEFEEWALWQDSGGPGKFRGGVGSRKTFRLTGGEARLSCLGDREHYPPFGIHGGQPGGNHKLIMDYGTAGETDLSLKVVGLNLKEGDRITILAGGGGGYGDPLERDPQKVAADVAMEYVSRERASLDYGVVIVEDETVDEAATAALRASMRKSRQ